jgi:DNA-binding transcriptional regulator GbsR (MarR family)
MDLSPLSEAFVVHFGEMGSRWGINRTIGQIYALLYVSSRPLCADEIAESLGFSRSNVSMGIKELQSWRLIRLQHLPGDRREYFSSPEDIWQIVRILAEERRRREIDPTLSVLRDMHELIELLTRWSDDVQKLNNEDLVQLLKLGGRVVRLLELKNRLPFLGRGAKIEAAGEIDEETAL